jgi:hypothetical protein
MNIQRHIHHLTLVVLFVVASAAATAQVRFRLASGLSTDWITNDNPAVYALTGSTDTSQPNRPYGGAFDGAQVGWGIRGYVDLDKQKTFRIPVGVDVFYYNGAQSVAATNYKFRVEHSNTLVSSFTGFEWSFVEFPLAFARAYVGGEARFLYVNANTISSDVTNIIDGEVFTTSTTYSGKSSAFRMGAMARLGIEGEIYYPVFLNTSVGYGVMNLLGRDTRSSAQGGRGELLTPRALNEAGEGVLTHLNFAFMIQVRI